ncbi:hypothetical protein, partial [Lactiplantibacillus pentosus]|uniref:hypothetical protein n=2 Tax=Lactobacillaceae TaxID=33958 RepID=UPI001CDBEF1A
PLTSFHAVSKHRDYWFFCVLNASTVIISCHLFSIKVSQLVSQKYNKKATVSSDLILARGSDC